MKNKKIIILHGWAYSTEKWKPFVEDLKKHEFTPIVLKIPGLTAPLENVWNIENYVEWLKKNLEKEDAKVILLGHSNGGRIALAFATQYPEKIDTLILIDSAGIYHNELRLRIKRGVFGFLSKTGKKITQSQKLRKIFYKFVREHDYEKANPIVRKTMQSLISVDLLPILKNISVPTIIIWGKEDKATPVKDAYLMKQQIKNSTLFIIENARHSPQFTNTKEVIGNILSKLS